jgi:hypothetical protein
LKFIRSEDADTFSVFEQRNAIRQQQRLRNVVGNEDHSLGKTLPKLAELALKFCP